jgi:low affinity Fe/Cu permease
MNEIFRLFASRISTVCGSSTAFIGAIVLVILWAAMGPLYHYSDTWQLTINTGTTIITFLMVFLIQNTQNRDAKSIQLKLDELLKGVKGARTEFVDIEDLAEEDLNELQKEFAALRKRYESRALERREHLQHREHHEHREHRKEQTNTPKNSD